MMIWFWLFILLAVAATDRIFRMFIEEIVQRHRFNLYALRDRLRESVTAGEVSPQNWVFLYLDSSIAKTVDVLDRITLWEVIVSAVLPITDERLLNARKHLQLELSKPKNKILAGYHNDYTELLVVFLFERHHFFRFVILRLLRLISFGQEIRRRWTRAVEFLTERPETSTLQEYAPA